MDYTEFLFLDKQHPERSSWEKVMGEFEVTDNGLSCPDPVNLQRYFIERPLMAYRLTFQITSRSGRTVFFLPDGYSFETGSSSPGSFTGISLDKAPVASTGLMLPAPGQPHDILYERANGCLRIAIDGQDVLVAQDPRPESVAHGMEIYIPADVVVHSMRLDGVFAKAGGFPIHRSHALQLNVCIDFNDDMLCAPWTERTFREAMAFYKEQNMRRVYFIYHYGYHGGFWGKSESADRTYAAVGDFLPATVRFAHEAGLECFAVIKPFEAAIYPAYCAGLSSDRNRDLDRLGGHISRLTHFVRDNPRLRIERRMDKAPNNLEGRGIHSLIFKAEQGLGNHFDPRHIQLWTSPDNKNYQRYHGPVNIRHESDGRRVVFDGLDMPHGFVGITVESEATRCFGNRIADLIEAYDKHGHILPLTYSQRPRDRRGTFHGDGFVFDHTPISCSVHQMDHYTWLDGGKPLGLAVGQERYLAGALCLDYPEVQAFWLDQVAACLAAGVDGIDFRVLNHNRTYDWLAYGFNEPTVRAFNARYGVDIINEPFSHADLRRLRGESYTGLLRAASRELRAAGKTMQLHISPRMCSPDWHTEMEIHFDWANWIREGLADEVTLKVTSLRAGIAPEAVHLARNAGLPVHFCPYLNLMREFPGGADYARHLRHDAVMGGADGFILYENAAFMAAQSDGSVAITKPWLVNAIAGR